MAKKANSQAPAIMDDDESTYFDIAVDGYRNNPKLKQRGVKFPFTAEQVREYAKCSRDPLYFIKKYVKIMNLDHGIVPFHMHEYQERMLDVVHKNRFSIMLCPRQVGKSTVVVAYFLWVTLFQPSQNIAIAANKAELARELLAKYQLGYEEIPMWMQQGILNWNKGSIELENKSKIKACATSGSAIRGQTFNFILLDEFAHIDSNLADSFFASTYPVITSGKKTKVIMVSTPLGMNHFYKFWNDAINKNNNFVPIRIYWQEVPGRDEAWKEETLRNIGDLRWAQEFECEFLGSSATLISGKKLQELTYKKPIFTDGSLDIYENPVKFDRNVKGSFDHQYVITVDVAEGKNQDYSTFSVIDVSEMPYRMVAKYRNNLIPPLLFPSHIINTAKMYNEAWVLVELNNVGQQVADIIHHELEYEHLIKTATGNKKAAQITGGYTKNSMLGLKTTEPIKKIGCLNLKTLIESNKLIVEDFETINEFTTFVQYPTGAYKAETGKHDDMVMSLVFFGWITTQKYFKEMISHDLRRQLLKEQFEELEDEAMLPVGFLADGSDDYMEVEDGDLWVEAGSTGAAHDPYYSIINNARKSFS